MTITKLKSQSSTQFLLDSCDHNETIQTIQTLAGINIQLFGQTTNPSLLVKNPILQTKLQNGKIAESDLLEFYQSEIQKISKLIPNGSISIEVYADQSSTAKDLLTQAEEFNSWIPNAHIKFPTINSGLEAAEVFVNNGGKVNMTLVFTQEQALAVHLISSKAKNHGDIFLSPFVGRLDDIGINGLDLVENCLRMYKELDSKVWVLAASIRTQDHFEKVLNMNCDIITAPLQSYTSHANSVNSIDSNLKSVTESPKTLQPIVFEELNYDTQNWKELNIQHSLTDQGLDKFIKDWKSILI